ncbi:MAG: lipoyl(octanoyl) transferase LipB [Acidiferrobacterales bacterium]
MDSQARVIIRKLGEVEYSFAWHAMEVFTRERLSITSDEIWLLTHPSVYTVGLRGRGLEFTSAANIPFVHSDRGGDMTYHGPGQLIAYVLSDLQRRSWGVRQLVHALEQSIIDLVSSRGIVAHRRKRAPGVYVDQKKIAALGLRVRFGRSYHGLALNVDMNMEPFAAIDPCGYPDLEVTQLADLGVRVDVEAAAELLVPHLLRNLRYNAARVDARPFKQPSAANGYG